MAVVAISSLSYVLMAVIAIAICVAKYVTTRRERREAPGPFPWPVIGNLHLLRGYDVPYQAFDDLARTYGKVFSLQMGSVPAVVVRGVDNIREVLVNRGHHFDSRPNFDRYHQLFHGNKENSLAFCDWSDLQKKRRDLLKDHTFPKVYTENYKHLDRIICEELRKLVDDIKDSVNNNGGGGGGGGGRRMRRRSESGDSAAKACDKALPKVLRRLMENKHVETIIRFPHYFASDDEVETPSTPPSVDLKAKLSSAVGNAFLRYFCSADLSRDPELGDFVRNFDEIFYEVNQGYAFDFLPFLAVFRRGQMNEIRKKSSEIRRFVLDKIVKARLEGSAADEDRDYLDSLLRNVRSASDGGDVRMDLDTALFSLEDIIGGHSAISNFLVKLVQFLVANKHVQARIKDEVDALGKNGFVTLEDRGRMPYTEAVVMETLRLLSSPIVPHVANQDTFISGYAVKKDTLIFLDNYELNMSENLWSRPKEFDPSRFLDPETGSKAKPSHFLPFGGGKRSCMGYKLVQFFSFAFVANVVDNFVVESATSATSAAAAVNATDAGNVATGNLALPPAQPFDFEFRVR